MPTNDDDIVLLTTAASPFDAKVIVGLLNSAGVPTYGNTGMLTDEFSMAQEALNLQGVEVRVPAASLERAQQVLREAEASRELLESDDFDPGRPED